MLRACCRRSASAPQPTIAKNQRSNGSSLNTMARSFRRRYVALRAFWVCAKYSLFRTVADFLDGWPPGQLSIVEPPVLGINELRQALPPSYEFLLRAQELASAEEASVESHSLLNLGQA